MDGGDFSCDKFQPQKWRKDVCRNCYQSLRVHAGKPETSPTSPEGVGGKDAKVFQRFRVNKEKAIDRSVPARERTPQKENLEGISAGKVASVAGDAPGDQMKSPSPVSPAENSVSPLPPSSSVRSALSKPQQPPVGSSEGAPFISPKSPPAVVSKPTANHAPLVAKVTPPIGLGTSYPRSTGGAKVPSRPPPPASAIHKPPPPATAGATRGPLSTKTPSPTPPTAPVHSPTNETETEPVYALRQLPGGAENDSDANKEVELKTEVIKADISRQEEALAKEEELKANKDQSKTNDLEESADVLCSEVSEPLFAESETPREGQGECNGETVEEEGEREGEKKLEDVKEEEERVTIDGAIVEEVMEVVEMTDSATKLECLFTEPDPTGGRVDEGTENEEIGGSQISAGEEGVDGGPQEAVNETSEVMEMEREEGESLNFAVSQLTEARTDEVTESGEVADVASTEPDGAMVADEEEEGRDEGDGEGTDGVMKSLKRKLSIKKKPKKAAADAAENSSSTEQGIRAVYKSSTIQSIATTLCRVVYCMASSYPIGMCRVGCLSICQWRVLSTISPVPPYTSGYVYSRTKDTLEECGHLSMHVSNHLKRLLYIPFLGVLIREFHCTCFIPILWYRNRTS